MKLSNLLPSTHLARVRLEFRRSRASVDPEGGSPTSRAAGPTAPREARRLQGFDGLRAFAALGVIAQHCLLWTSGWVGLWLFFVISGMFITRSLERMLEWRSPGRRLVIFYQHRMLRIIPVYLLFILGMWIIFPGVESIPNSMGPLLTFTYNYWSIFHPNDNVPPIAHLWSLSSEEQFYLVWPWLYCLAPRRVVMGVLVLVVAGAPLARMMWARHLLGEGLTVSDAAYGVLFSSFSSLDAFAAGCLLAMRGPNPAIGPWIALATASLAATVAGVAIGLGSSLGAIRHLAYVETAAVWGSVATLIVVLRDRGVIAGIVRWRPLAYLGRISYGVYVYHGLALVVLERSAPRLIAPDAEWVLHLGAWGLCGGSAILLAALSHRLMETPLSRLRMPSSAQGAALPA